MKPKTAIIILIIIVTACGLFMVYLFGVMNPVANNNILNKKINSKANSALNQEQSDNPDNQVKDKGQRRLETIKAMEEAEKINPSIIPKENTQAIEQRRLETIKAMIQNGLGWGVLPESMIDESLQKLKIKDVKMERHLGVLLHQSRTLSSPAKTLLETLKNSN